MTYESTPTPSSLKWLINRRARLAGEITKEERAHQQALKQAEDDHLRVILALNAGIDAIDPNLIKPICSQDYIPSDDYGSMTRAIN